MKSKPLILVAFLFVLFMIPLSFPNVAATEYEYSPDSISEFYETLPNDVLFYPDALDLEVRVADGGDTSEYVKSQIKDYVADPFSTCVVTGDTTTDELYYTPELGGRVDDFDYAIYGFGDGTGTVKYYDNGWQVLETITAEDWYNGSMSLSYPTREVRLQLSATGGHDLYTDYVEVQIALMTYVIDGTPFLSNSYFATGGDTGYENTSAVDSANFSVTLGAGTLEFSYDPSNISSFVSFTYAIYGTCLGSFPVSYSSDDIYYGTGPFDVITSTGWYNGTVTAEVIGSLENTGIGYVFFGSEVFPEADIDYMDLSFTYIPISAYGESFTNGSDWGVSESGVIDGTISTNGDIANISCSFDDAGNEYVWVSTNTTITVTDANVFELRLKFKNDKALVTLRFYDGADFYYENIYYESGWFTTKLHLGGMSKSGTISTIDEIRIYFDDNPNAEDSGGNYIEVDYLRIGPSTETGWQHDGSITEGLWNDGSVNWLYDNSTDGDILTLNMTSNVSGNAWSHLQISYDLTSTPARLERDYYPFVEMRWRCTSTDAYKIYPAYYFDGHKSDGFEYTDTFDWTITRFNIAAMDDAYIPNSDGVRFVIWSQTLGSHAIIEVDYIKAYSIADYTVTHGSAITTNDIFYVEDGILYCENDNADYIGLLLDPAISVTDTYDLWNISTPTGLGNEFSFRVYVNPDWTSYNDEETNGTLPSGTVTNLAFYAYNDVTISAISFRGIVPSWQIITNVELGFFVLGWHIITSVIVIFVTEISTYTLNLFFLFLGLVMIPTSSIYLVKGGRDEMSMDKVFFGIVVFILGWALFLGGIFV